MFVTRLIDLNHDIPRLLWLPVSATELFLSNILFIVKRNLTRFVLVILVASGHIKICLDCFNRARNSIIFYQFFINELFVSTNGVSRLGGFDWPG